MTTLEKIDAMLKWLDEGSNEPFSISEGDTSWMVCTEGKLGGGNAPVHNLSVRWYLLGGSPSGGLEKSDARNIAALLNSSREELVKLRGLLEVAERDPSMVSGGVKIVTEAIVDIRYKAFVEARGEDHKD